MHDSKDLNRVRQGSVKDEHVLKTCDTKDSQGLESRVLQAGLPTHPGLRGEKHEGPLRGGKEPQANVNARLFDQVIGIVV